MNNTEPAWRQIARGMHAMGANHRTVANFLGLNIGTVERFTSMDRGVFIDFGKFGNTICEEALIETHVTRPIRQVINEAAVMPAAARFARGEISRTQLMQAIAA